jgi:hypothetical protein
VVLCMKRVSRHLRPSVVCSKPAPWPPLYNGSSYRRRRINAERRVRATALYPVDGPSLRRRSQGRAGEGMIAQHWLLPVRNNWLPVFRRQQQFAVVIREANRGIHVQGGQKNLGGAAAACGTTWAWLLYVCAVRPTGRQTAHMAFSPAPCRDSDAWYNSQPVHRKASLCTVISAQ